MSKEIFLNEEKETMANKISAGLMEIQKNSLE